MKNVIIQFLAISAILFSVEVVAQVTITDNATASTDSTQASNSSATSTRSVGRYIDDKTISTKINAEFLADTDLKSDGLKVRTYRGVVTLSGHTTSQDQVATAIAKVRTVAGVKAVRNHIKIVDAN